MSSRLCAVSEASVPNPGAELILPCRYFDLSSTFDLSGERRLMLALLADAINVYQRGAISSATRARRLFIDAESWIMATGLTTTGLSFETVCDALGINPGLLRRRVIEWKHAMQRHCAAHSTGRPRLRITRHPRHTSHRRGRPPAHVPAFC